jgi:endonuclease III
MPDAKQAAALLLRRYGTTFAEELGLDLSSQARSEVFCWFLASLLFSTRISHTLAQRAARSLLAHGWKTPQALARSTWQQRVTALDEGGYVRYDERTSTMLGEAAEMLIARYKGDFGKLREAAGRDPARERELLKEFKGIGDVAVNIFFREMQLAWPELFPFADERTLADAKALRLPASAESLRRLVRSRRDFVRLVSALVRVRLEHRQQEWRELAAA